MVYCHRRKDFFIMSEYLQQYSSKVERLGFDENFIDITELVNDRISNQHGKPDDDVVGHVYGEEPSTLGISLSKPQAFS